MLNAYGAEKIFTGETWLRDHVVVCQGSRITAVLPRTGYSGTINETPGTCLVPAFIDLQIYGAGGRLLAVYPDEQSLHTLVDHCAAGGTAYCLPTIATNTSETVYRSIDAVKRYLRNGGKGILGLHLEGPWLNPGKRGAHIETLIHPPTLAEVKELLNAGKGIIRMITLAPEVCTPEIGMMLKEQGIIISAGHSNATFDEANAAFSSYVTTVTHLFNAMSPFAHRAPGLAGAVMDNKRITASIIPDGHHVDYAAIRIAKAVMKERLYAITDAVTATGEGYYQHYAAGDKYEAGGVLSGSALAMNRAAANLVSFAGVEEDEALRMCSLYPARVMNMDQDLGRIAPGYTAAMTALDEHFNVKQLICYS